MKRSARWFSWFLVVFASVLVVRAGVRDRGVITDHLEFGRRLLAGEDLYAPYLEAKPLHPPYPPSFGLLTSPFSLLPERAARWAWALLQAGCVVYVFGWLRRALASRWPSLHVDLVLLLTLLLGVRFVLRDTHGGGGNLINLALVLGAFEASARGRPLLGGACLGFSLATKPTAVLFLPLLWLFGWRRAAAGAAGTALACAGLSLALLRGRLDAWSRWFEGTRAYATQVDVFAPPALGFPPFTWMNQSLRCAVARVLGDVPAPLAAEVPGFLPGLGWEPPAVAAVRTGLSLLLLAATAVVVWRRRHDERAHFPLVAATFALSLLLSPISWKAHHVALLPCFALVFVAALAGRTGAWVFAGIYTVTCVLGEEITGKALKELLQSSYVVTLGTLALWGFSLRVAARGTPG